MAEVVWPSSEGASLRPKRWQAQMLAQSTTFFPLLPVPEFWAQSLYSRCERERETESDRERERQRATERQTERESDKERQTERETERDRERQRERDRQTQRERQT